MGVATLGIVGTPPDRRALEDVAQSLDLDLIYLAVDAREADGFPDGVKCAVVEEGRNQDRADLEIDGIYIADPARYAWAEAVARQLSLPFLPCPDMRPGTICPYSGARAYALDELEEGLKRGRREVGVPAWVRASCGDGDGSCMRVDHLSDLSLALQKLRNRNPAGVLRIQPAIEGDIYRLVGFKAGGRLVSAMLLEEWVTSSVYRVPLGMAFPVPADCDHCADILRQAADINERLPEGWGAVEMEFVASDGQVTLTDVQAPATLGADLQRVALYALGVDLMAASMQCALGRIPNLTPRREHAVAFSWLLTRSGIVTGFEGLEGARALPGVVDIQLNAREGDILSHVVDVPSRERGGWIMTEGASLAEAKSRLESAREHVWINTSPALS